MAHEIALSMVNDLKMQLSRLARSTAEAMKDGKVTPLEGIMLANAGMQIGVSLIAMMQNRDLAIKEDILYILEHGTLTVDDTTTFMVQPPGETEKQVKQEQEAAKAGELRSGNSQQVDQEQQQTSQQNEQEQNQPIQNSPADISQLHKSGMATTTDHDHIHEQEQAINVGQYTSQSHGQQQVDPSHSQEQLTAQQKDELRKEQEQHNADMIKDQPQHQPRRSRP